VLVPALALEPALAPPAPLPALPTTAPPLTPALPAVTTGALDSAAEQARAAQQAVPIKTAEALENARERFITPADAATSPDRLTNRR
jgi:hypothetical protein